MMKGKNILFVVLAVILPSLGEGCGSGCLYAQKILKDTTFIIVKQFQPTIADAYKINDLPLVKDSVPPVPKLNYVISSKKVFTPYNVETLKSAKMVGEPLARLYNGLIKIGAGNYNTPSAEIFYANGRSKEYSYGAHAKHLSSKADMAGYGFGGVSDNQIEWYGKKFFRKETLAGNLDYNRNVIHYYGYDTSVISIADNDYIKQRYSRIGGDVSLQSHYTDSVHLNYLLKLKYYNLSDFYTTSENNLSTFADFSGYYDKQLFHVPLSVDYYNNKYTGDTTNSVLIGVAPRAEFAGDKWRAGIGIRVAVEGGENTKSHFLFLPGIDFNYNVVENIIIPYAGLTNGLEKNSLKTLSDENPFIVPSPTLGTTVTKWKVYGGVRGSISKALSYNTRTSYSKMDDLNFFVNDNSDVFTKGFNLLYQNVNLWNIHGELQFQNAEKIKLFAKGDYNSYRFIFEQDTILTIEPKAWHRPLFQFTFSANYNLKNKIVVKADVFVIGKRLSYTPAQGQGTGIAISSTAIHELQPIIDANLGFEYRYSKKLSAFVNLNNLGFKRYEIWNNYPSYKFNFLAGITVAF